jgi:hypothetical protein
MTYQSYPKSNANSPANRRPVSSASVDLGQRHPELHVETYLSYAQWLIEQVP